MVFLAGAAQGADLTTVKGSPANCLADFKSWLFASPTDCPLSYGGFTLYGSVDFGASYETNAATFGDKAPNPIENVIGPQGRGSRLEWADNQLSPSNVGIKFSERAFGDVNLIGDWRLGFDPVSARALDGPGSLIDNNGVGLPFRAASGSASWNGALDNGRAWIGLQSPTLGALRFGRFSNFYADIAPFYSADGASWGFSALGFSATWSSGLGITESNRDSLGISYLYDYDKLFHIGGQTEIGGFEAGNFARNSVNFDIGGAFQGFSIDGVYQHSVDAIHLGAWSGAIPAAVDLTQDLTATLANQDAWALMASYKHQALTVYGVYSYARLSNPSDTTYPKGWTNVLGSDYDVLGGATAGSVNTGAYAIPEVLQVAAVSAKYAVNPQFDLIGAYAHVWQNDFDYNAATGAATPAGTGNCAAFAASPAGYDGVIPAGTKRPDCAGHTDVTSVLLDYRPVKRLDVYGGVIYSKGAGGQVSGYWADHNTALTAGLRLSF